MSSEVLFALLLMHPFSAGDEEFDTVWYDGRAEVSGYRWTGSRYGELRSGEAVAIFVTEPFSQELFVKLDRPTGSERDRVTAMKLNLVRDFQTGVYDYNTMVSCFVRADDFSLMKLSFSSAEWCGHVYEEVLRTSKATEIDTRSYFQGESGRKSLAARAEGIVGEQLFVFLRGLRGHPLEPGASKGVPFLAGSFERRLRHAPASWGQAKIVRSSQTTEVVIPAGRFSAIVYAIEATDGRRGTVHIEAAYPHRLLAWEWKRGGEVLDAAEMTGSQRMSYWELHGEGQEKLRREIGLDD